MYKKNSQCLPIKIARCFPPAIIHIPLSSFIFWSSWLWGNSLWLNIRAFLSFQISHGTKMIIERIPFLEWQGTTDREVHHWWSDSACDQEGKKRPLSPIEAASSSRIRMEYLQWARRWRKFLALYDRGGKQRCWANLSPGAYLPSKVYFGWRAIQIICI